jgi:membrane-associated protein
MTIRTRGRPTTSFYWPVRVEPGAAGRPGGSTKRHAIAPSVGDMRDVLSWLAQLPPTQIYVVAGLLLAAEVGLLAGLAVPAASIMLGLGALAGDGHLRLATAIAVAVIAALLGDSIAYWEGRFVGPRLRAGRLGRRIGVRRWRRAERMIRRRVPGIALGRWTAYVRTLVPRVAGCAGVGYAMFLAYEVPAVLVWTPGTILVGYLSGATLR